MEPSKINIKGSVSRRIIFKLQKTKGKEKILKGASKREKILIYQETDFLSKPGKQEESGVKNLRMEGKKPPTWNATSSEITPQK